MEQKERLVIDSMKGKTRKKFTCPACNKEIFAYVTDTEIDYRGCKRYRKCEECGVSFVTLERIVNVSNAKYTSEG